MKKLLLFAIILGGSIAFTSCSKKGDYNCACTIDFMGTSTTTESVMKDVKEKDAEEACDKLDETASASCTLKDA